MRSVNKVILIGNVTRDPEIRRTQSGQAVCTFGLATNREWVTSDSRKKQSAEYHELVAWARLADICERFVRKGKLLYVEGYLKTRSWDTPEGIRKFKTEVVIQDMIMLEKRASGDDDYMPSGEESGYSEDQGDYGDYHDMEGEGHSSGGSMGDDDASSDDNGMGDDSSGSDDSAASDDDNERKKGNVIDDDLGL